MQHLGATTAFFVVLASVLISWLPGPVEAVPAGRNFGWWAKDVDELDAGFQQLDLFGERLQQPASDTNEAGSSGSNFLSSFQPGSAHHHHHSQLDDFVASSSSPSSSFDHVTEPEPAGADLLNLVHPATASNDLSQHSNPYHQYPGSGFEVHPQHYSNKFGEAASNYQSQHYGSLAQTAESWHPTLAPNSVNYGEGQYSYTNPSHAYPNPYDHAGHYAPPTEEPLEMDPRYRQHAEESSFFVPGQGDRARPANALLQAASNVHPSLRHPFVSSDAGASTSEEQDVTSRYLAPSNEHDASLIPDNVPELFRVPTHFTYAGHTDDIDMLSMIWRNRRFMYARNQSPASSRHTIDINVIFDFQRLAGHFWREKVSRLKIIRHIESQPGQRHGHGHGHGQVPRYTDYYLTYSPRSLWSLGDNHERPRAFYVWTKDPLNDATMMFRGSYPIEHSRWNQIKGRLTNGDIVIDFQKRSIQTSPIQPYFLRETQNQP